MRFGKLTIVMAGFFTGVVFAVLTQKWLLSHTPLLDETMLYRMKSAGIDEATLFFYCLQKRLGGALFMVVLSTTYLGMALIVLACLWVGACGGCLMTIAVLRYGIKGMGLVFVAVSPQAFFLLPGFFLLIRWCEGLFRRLYPGKGIKREAGKKIFPPRCLLQLCGIVIVLIVGCLLEGLVNPGWLQGFLKIF